MTRTELSIRDVVGIVSWTVKYGSNYVVNNFTFVQEDGSSVEISAFARKQLKIVKASSYIDCVDKSRDIFRDKGK